MMGEQGAEKLNAEHAGDRVDTHWLHLCDAVVSGEFTEDQRSEFERRLTENPDLAESFLSYSALAIDLQNVASRAPALELARTVVENAEAGNLSQEITQRAVNSAAGTSPREQSRRLLFGVLASAVAILLAAALWNPFAAQQSVVNSQSSTPAYADGGTAGDGSRPSVYPIAIIGKAEGVQWATPTSRRALSDVLNAGDWIEIESGSLEIEFSQGAVAVIEGPARFAPKGPNSGVLTSGKLAAVVPPWADGFQIDTPSLRVIDRGTQFAISVDRDQCVDVAVTKGEVEIAHTEADQTVSDTRLVTAGDGVRADASGVQSVDVNASLVSLARQLPQRPDETQVEVVGRYRVDFVPGVPDQPARSGSWRYYTNAYGPIGDPKNYQELLWDPNGEGHYDVNGSDADEGDGPLAIAKLRSYSGHPGHGSEQARDKTDRYVIATYITSSEGVYRLESGWIVRPENRKWLENQAVDVFVHVNDAPPVLQADCEQNENCRFRADLGLLPAGAKIHVAVGPKGINYNDRFEWGFVFTRELIPENDAL